MTEVWGASRADTALLEAMGALLLDCTALLHTAAELTSSGGEVPPVSLEAITRSAGTLIEWLDRPQRVPKHLRVRQS